MTDKRLAEIEARAAKATPGPWQSRFIYRLFSMVRRYASRLGLMLGPDNDWVDADFIAHARTDIPLLIAEVRRLRTQYDELRDALCSKSWAPRDNHDRVVLARHFDRAAAEIRCIAKVLRRKHGITADDEIRRERETVEERRKAR